jgi:hypothetical protein
VILFILHLRFSQSQTLWNLTKYIAKCINIHNTKSI